MTASAKASQAPSRLQPGTVTIAAAARHLGIDPKAVISLAARHDVPIRPCPVGTRPSKPKAGTTRRATRRCVDLAALVAVATKETRETETIRGAAVRRGLCEQSLRTWLREAGLIPPGTLLKAYVRVPTTDIEQVLRDRGATETPSEGARRHKVCPTRLRGWLLKAKVLTEAQKGQWVRVAIADVDRVVQANRIAPGTETPTEGARRHGLHKATLRGWLREAGALPRHRAGQHVWVQKKIVDRVVNSRRAQVVERLHDDQ